MIAAAETYLVLVRISHGRKASACKKLAIDYSKIWLRSSSSSLDDRSPRPQ